MEPKTLSPMNPSETQIKNRLLASENGGNLPTTSTTYLDEFNTYNPQSIMDKYAEARKLTTDSADATTKRLESEYSTATEDINIDDTKGLTQNLEGQRGFAQMPVALNYMQISHDKRIRDLTKQKNELILSNESDKAKRLSDLILDEETAISNAKTNFLNNYFAIKGEERAIAAEDREIRGFETPEQKSQRALADATKQSVLNLSSIAPDAGILDTDDYNTAISKYRNSDTYKRDVRRGEAEIQSIQANIRQSNAAAAKSLADANGSSVTTGAPYNGEFAATIDIASNMFGTNEQRKNVSNTMKNFIANKDYASAYAVVAQATRTALKGEAATRFDNQLNSLGVLDGLETAIKAYSDAGGNTNIFKGSADKIQGKIGALMTDPKYASLAVQLNAAFQNYRLQMTGAAFSPEESAEYATILPAPGNTMDLNLAKLSGARAYLNSSVNSSIKNTIGEGGVHIRDYAMGAAIPNAPAGSTGSKTLSAPTFQGFQLKF